MYYKRDHSLRWLGPAKVVFQDRKIVLLDHGGYYIKVSPNLLRKIHSQFAVPENNSTVKDNSEQVLPINDNPVVDGSLVFDDVNDTDNDLAPQNIQGNAQVDNTGENEVQEPVLDAQNEVQEPVLDAQNGNVEEPVRQSLCVFNKKQGASVYIL